ncbi:MAG: lipoprotein-releasing ABC transporter ATP-binding protein LolD [Gammaproteobacteria bacterium]|nr:lipoprotein-releasing ABC transporter ATP-binding protein LolD [Gammaproteobacteria bacterium]
MSANQNNVIEVNALSKSFHDGDLNVNVLKHVDFSLQARERIAIVGASGSGKSTLLQLLGGLDKPSKGQVTLCGNNLNEVNDTMRGELRNQYLGFIYQFHHLLPEFTALENVAMPLMVRNQSVKKIQQQAKEILGHVGLKDRIKHKPSELSGGERQRVAIARALVTQPKVILADEPTGNLDSKTALQVSGLMTELNIELDTAIVLVTHDMSLAETMDSIYEIKDGVLTTT